ncbi:MAG: hypothetical protein IJR68_09420 [Fretibacterium sp.]|nr:hypothetical protein [Fretibacterium sp.]
MRKYFGFIALLLVTAMLLAGGCGGGSSSSSGSSPSESSVIDGTWTGNEGSGTATATDGSGETLKLTVAASSIAISNSRVTGAVKIANTMTSDVIFSQDIICALGHINIGWEGSQSVEMESVGENAWSFKYADLEITLSGVSSSALSVSSSALNVDVKGTTTINGKSYSIVLTSSVTKKGSDDNGGNGNSISDSAVLGTWVGSGGSGSGSGYNGYEDFPDVNLTTKSVLLKVYSLPHLSEGDSGNAKIMLITDAIRTDTGEILFYSGFPHGPSDGTYDGGDYPEEVEATRTGNSYTFILYSEGYPSFMYADITLELNSHDEAYISGRLHGIDDYGYEISGNISGIPVTKK